jgi:hypothetical protein
VSSIRTADRSVRQIPGNFPCIRVLETAFSMVWRSIWFNYARWPRQKRMRIGDFVRS